MASVWHRTTAATAGESRRGQAHSTLSAQANAKAERFIQALLREWAYVRPYATSKKRRAALEPGFAITTAAARMGVFTTCLPSADWGSAVNNVSRNHT